MGWNTWNRYACDISEATIRNMADTMATNGMKAAGYEYINIDDCWQVGRDPWGGIIADPVRFPSGIKALADYVHSKGLKLGIYSDHGLLTCQSKPGGFGYEYLDANTYASWGIDYLKYDNCFLPAGDVPQADYFRMSDGLMNSGRPIVFSICAWSFASWDPDLGNLWRTTGDISDSYSSMVSKLAENSQSAFIAGPGRWNDPDMLEVGVGALNATENKTHFTLWCMMAAPLIAGNDLTAMSPGTLSILTNPEVIAVDQDSAGEQGIQVSGSTTNQVWCKPLGTDFTTKAVALFNNDSNPANITVSWSSLGLQSGSATVRDLWARTDLGTFNNSFTANVPAHGVVMLKVSGTAPALPSLGTNYLSDLQQAYCYLGWGHVIKDKTIGGNTLTLNGISYSKGLGVHAFSGYEYRLGGIASRFQADIGVDDEVGGNGTVVFQVYADGTKIYDSGVISGGGARQSIDLDVTGVNRLTLGVANGDNGIDYDHADWAGARVVVTNLAAAPPAIPAGLTAMSGNPIKLAWNVTPSATSYEVKRSLAANGPYTNLGSVDLSAYNDNNVNNGHTYYYTISAVNNIGGSPFSSAVSATSCSSPAVPNGLSAQSIGRQVNLSWITSSGATEYTVFRSTSGTPLSPIGTDLTSPLFTDTNLMEGNTYFYAVAASNPCGQSGVSAVVTHSVAPLPPTGLTATSAGDKVMLNWSPASLAAGYSIKRSSDNGHSYLRIGNFIYSSPWEDSGLVDGQTYLYVVTAISGDAESSNSIPVSATPCSGGLPDGWSQQDIGSVGVAGTAEACLTSFVVQGSGSDIWGTADAFHFVSTSLTGDGMMVAQVTSIQNTDPWAKGGIMFRDGSNAGAMFASLFCTASGGVSLQWRTTSGGQCASIDLAGVKMPVWVKLTRSGNTFTGYYGADGLTWTQVGLASVSMPGSALIGLALTSHNNSSLCSASFKNVTMVAPTTPENLAASSGNGSVLLSWSTVPGAAGYVLSRALVSGGPYTLLADTANVFYTDTNVVSGTAYYYVAAAVNAIGLSATGLEVRATPNSPPVLSFQQADGEVRLKWPGSANDYLFYSASNLAEPINWQLLTNAIQSNNGNFNIVLPVTNQQQFFRLGK